MNRRWVGVVGLLVLWVVCGRWAVSGALRWWDSRGPAPRATALVAAGALYLGLVAVAGAVTALRSSVAGQGLDDGPPALMEIEGPLGRAERATVAWHMAGHAIVVLTHPEFVGRLEAVSCGLDGAGIQVAHPRAGTICGEGVWARMVATCGGQAAEMIHGRGRASAPSATDETELRALVDELIRHRTPVFGKRWEPSEAEALVSQVHEAASVWVALFADEVERIATALLAADSVVLTGDEAGGLATGRVAAAS